MWRCPCCHRVVASCPGGIGHFCALFKASAALQPSRSAQRGRLLGQVTHFPVMRRPEKLPTGCTDHPAAANSHRRGDAGRLARACARADMTQMRSNLRWPFAACVACGTVSLHSQVDCAPSHGCRGPLFESVNISQQCAHNPSKNGVIDFVLVVAVGITVSYGRLDGHFELRRAEDA